MVPADAVLTETIDIARHAFLEYVMRAVPTAIPFTTPVAEPTDAIVEALLLHVPPETELVREVVEVRHTESDPPMAAGCAFTVTTRVVFNPHHTVYVIVDVPAERPLTTPEAGSIVATEVLLLIHVPVFVVDASVVTAPSHTDAVPVIVATVATAVTVLVAVAPHPVLYRIDTLPLPTPVTIPVVKPTVALAVLLLLHVPYNVVLLKVVCEPTQTRVGDPVMGAGIPFIVIFLVVALVTVPDVLHVPEPSKVTTQ